MRYVKNGIDVAITAQIKGFEKAGLLEVNDDMNYTGFFTNESKTHYTERHRHHCRGDLHKTG
jgi:hypothetical protein